jgi:hypothetical protein
LAVAAADAEIDDLAAIAEVDASDGDGSAEHLGLEWTLEVLLRIDQPLQRRPHLWMRDVVRPRSRSRGIEAAVATMADSVKSA